MSSLLLSKTCEVFRSGFESLPAFIGAADQRDGALVPVPLMPGCGVRDVDRREVVQVSARFFCPSVGLLRISMLFILLPPPAYDDALYCVPMLLFWHPLLSNGLLATESRRASCPLSDELVQGRKGLPKPGNWL